MKISGVILLLVASFWFGSGFGLTCTANKCVGSGSVCNAISGTYCTPGYWCSINSTCIAQTPIGGACDATSMCVNGYTCGTSNTCVPQSQTGIWPSQSCTANVDFCTYGSQSVLCPSNGICPYKTVGQLCSTNYECQYLQCNGGTCTAALPNGAPCANDITAVRACSSGYCVYDFTLGRSVCTAKYSVQLGGICAKTTDCATGLYCTANYTTPLGTCQPYGPPSFKACSLDSDCASPETCLCDYDGSHICVGPQYSSTAANNFHNCLAQYGCDYSNTACVLQNCKAFVCPYAQVTYPPKWNASFLADGYLCFFGADLTYIQMCMGTYSVDPATSVGSFTNHLHNFFGWSIVLVATITIFNFLL